MVNHLGYGAQSGGLYDLLYRWQQMGVYDIILPFLLVFTISFAVLQKVKIFGAQEGVKKINVVIAFVIALLFLQNKYLIFILQRFLPNISIVMIVVLMFLLLVGIFGGQFLGLGGIALNIAFIFSILATVIALSVDFFPGQGGYGVLGWFYNFDPGIRDAVILVLIVLGVIALVTYEGGGKDSYAKRLSGDIANAFEHGKRGSP